MAGDGTDRTDGAWRPPAAGAPPAREPEEIPGYVELTEIGRGGDSVVYRARQVSVGRQVAVKVLGTDDPTRVARFRREVDITVDLGRQHPNIITLLDVGQTAGGRPYLVMDLAEAGTAHDRLATQGPLPPHEVAELGYVLADALAFAHERDVLHRDVKPQNVLVLPTSWMLSDFGIARLAGSEHTASVETFTYRHAAPQVLDGMSPSRADDLWALGSTLFTLLDGRPPFASDDPDEDSALAYIRRARTEPHRPLAVEGAERLAAVIDRCLQKDPADRWPDAASLRDALASLRADTWRPDAPAAPLAPGPSLPAEPYADASAPAAATSAAGTEEPAAAEVAAAEAAAADQAPASPTSSAGDVPPVPVAGTSGPAAAPPAEKPDVPAPREPAWAPDAEPEPLALSVLSHAPVQHEPDGAPTGTGVPAPTDPARATTGADAPAAAAAGADGDDAGGGGRRGRRRDHDASPGDRRRRTLLIGLGVLALVVGLGLGVVGAALRGGDEPDDQQASDGGSAPVGQPVPEDPEPEVTDEALEPRPDPDLSILFENLDASGFDIEMSWSDPSEGDAKFVISQTSGPDVQGVRALYEVPPGTTEYVLPGALVAGGRQCYVISLYMPTGEFGISDVRCITAPEG